MLPLLFPGSFAGDVLSKMYFLFEAHFFIRSTFSHVRKMLLGRPGVDFKPFLTLLPDFVPFAMWIAFPEPTWVSMLQRFTLRGFFQVLSEDVPWTADFKGHPLLNFAFSPGSALFLLLDLHCHHQCGHDFADGIAHFVVLCFRIRYNNFLQMMSAGGRFWNRQYIDFLLKVNNLSITDALDMASMVTLTSPRCELLWNLGALYHSQASRGYVWVRHTFVKRKFWDQSIQLRGPTDSLVDPALLARYFGHLILQ